MKQQIETLLQNAIKEMQASGELKDVPAYVQVDPTKDKTHGEFASNIALVLAKSAQKKPRDVAQRIVSLLPKTAFIEKIEIAGPGFINFFLSNQALNSVVATILAEKEKYGRNKMGRGKRILVEFVSSNPTGPLHVGHGRHAAFGAAVANLLDAVGFKVSREYYVNDAGRQMDIVAVSVWIRYLNLCGESIPFPSNAYQGDYVKEISNELYQQYQARFQIEAEAVLQDLPLDEPQGGDKELYMDAIIDRAKHLLQEKYNSVFDFALNKIMTDIRDDLTEFGIHYDHWFSEREFVNTQAVDKLLAKLKESGHVFEREGALWFRSTDFDDEKDRVLVRSNGQRTYFANDVAYHLNKFERGFDISIDLLGADHHGYIPRMKAAMQASGIDPERLIILLVQFVSLYRGPQQISMSTRGGNFVTLRDLRKEVGNDAARFFYVMRKCEQPVDFDLELAKAQSNENPVYYIQYAHARICSVFKQLLERKWTFDSANGLAHLDLLTSPYERDLLNTLSLYPDIIVNAALHYEPHLLTHYLRELSTDFHAYYNSEQFLVEDSNLRDARLALISSVRQTLLNGFNLLGITAPESM